jgi:hypothetical protein
MGSAGTEGSGGKSGDEEGAHDDKLGMPPRRFNPADPSDDRIAGALPKP